MGMRAPDFGFYNPPSFGASFQPNYTGTGYSPGFPSNDPGLGGPGPTGAGANPYGGMPSYPTYTPIYNPSTMALSPTVNANLAGAQLDTSGVNALKASALRTGPSPWAKAATEQSYGDEARAADQLQKQNASSVATAQNNLAMRGGTRSGANERLATAGATAVLGGRQGVAQQGAAGRQQITTNDEQNRMAQLGMLPGAELGAANFGLQKATASNAARATDIQNQMLGNQSVNQFNLGAYNTAGQIWGAGKQADATANSGSNSWLCTEASKQTATKYTQDQRRALTMLAKYAKQVDPQSAHFYFSSCGQLIDKMIEASAPWASLLEAIQKIALRITSGDLEGGYLRYCVFVKDMLDRYWPSCRDPVYSGVLSHGAI